MPTHRTKRIFADPPPWYGLAPFLMTRELYDDLLARGLSAAEITNAARAAGYGGVEIIDVAALTDPLDN